MLLYSNKCIDKCPCSENVMLLYSSTKTRRAALRAVCAWSPAMRGLAGAAEMRQIDVGIIPDDQRELCCMICTAVSHEIIWYVSSELGDRPIQHHYFLAVFRIANSNDDTSSSTCALSRRQKTSSERRSWPLGLLRNWNEAYELRNYSRRTAWTLLFDITWSHDFIFSISSGGKYHIIQQYMPFVFYGENKHLCDEKLNVNSLYSSIILLMYRQLYHKTNKLYDGYSSIMISSTYRLQTDKFGNPKALQLVVTTYVWPLSIIISYDEPEPYDYLSLSQLLE